MNAIVHPFPPRTGLAAPPKAVDKPLIVGLAGPIGCGKSTAARRLEAAHGFARTRFAGPLKAMLRALLLQAGFNSDTIDRMIEGDLKEQPHPALGFRTPRHAMQTLGTEWGRGAMSPDFWAALWGAGVERLIGMGYRRIVVEDLRFRNEAAVVQALGGVTVAISRASAEAARATAAHESERLDFATDRRIENAGSLNDFERTIDLMAQGMTGGG